MAARRSSAGILLHRDRGARLEVLLGHMGGPFWAKKDAGAWSIPKGEYEPDENAMAAALREFAEEMGSPAPSTDLTALGTFTQAGGKMVSVWAAESDFDAASVVSNTFRLEWPPRSGRFEEFPEIDRAEWLDLPAARAKIVKGQVAVLDALERLLATE
jgi:predicted NUDIX family NTP pyrophosphohydrolase